MILTVPRPSAANRRPPAPAPLPAQFPAELWSADDPESAMSATVVMPCEPFEWPAPAGEAEPAGRAASPPPEPTRAGEVPWADRRMADRVPVRPGARAEVRRWGRRGADFAEELLNVSAAGLCVRLSTAVRRGEKFDVTLWGPDGGWCGRGLGVVRWVVLGEAGSAIAGLLLGRRLTGRALGELT